MHSYNNKFAVGKQTIQGFNEKLITEIAFCLLFSIDVQRFVAELITNKS